MYIMIITYCITHPEAKIILTRWALIVYNSLKLEPKLSPIAKS